MKRRINKLVARELPDGALGKVAGLFFDQWGIKSGDTKQIASLKIISFGVLKDSAKWEQLQSLEWPFLDQPSLTWIASPGSSCSVHGLDVEVYSMKYDHWNIAGRLEFGLYSLGDRTFFAFDEQDLEKVNKLFEFIRNGDFSRLVELGLTGPKMNARRKVEKLVPEKPVDHSKISQLDLSKEDLIAVINHNWKTFRGFLGGDKNWAGQAEYHPTSGDQPPWLEVDTRNDNGTIGVRVCQNGDPEVEELRGQEFGLDFCQVYDLKDGRVAIVFQV
jgi:hypothetical protein